MKKVLIRGLLLFVLLGSLLSIGFVVNAASYPLMYPDDYSLTVIKGTTAELKFKIFNEYKNEEYHVNVYQGKTTDPNKLVASAEDTIYNYGNYMTNVTVTWDTTGVECGIYTVEYYMSFYSLYEWHDEPTKHTLMTVNVIEMPDTNVTVSIPTFPITINGTVLDNENLQYPYIVYNNITYCPMTYNGSRFLGLDTNWTSADGLSINKLGVASIGVGDNTLSNQKNVGSYPAVMSLGKIKINDKNIDNLTEEYPILTFRNVTYFPLTWKFAVTEFGWDYSYTNETGLVINSK